MIDVAHVLTICAATTRLNSGQPAGWGKGFLLMREEPGPAITALIKTREDARSHQPLAIKSKVYVPGKMSSWRVFWGEDCDELWLDERPFAKASLWGARSCKSIGHKNSLLYFRQLFSFVIWYFYLFFLHKLQIHSGPNVCVGWTFKKEPWFSVGLMWQLR